MLPFGSNDFWRISLVVGSKYTQSVLSSIATFFRKPNGLTGQEGGTVNKH